MTNKDLEDPYNHMAAIYAAEAHDPGALAIAADVDANGASDGLGFSRPVLCAAAVHASDGGGSVGCEVSAGCLAILVEGRL